MQNHGQAVDITLRNGRLAIKLLWGHVTERANARSELASLHGGLGDPEVGKKSTIMGID